MRHALTLGALLSVTACSEIDEILQPKDNAKQVQAVNELYEQGKNQEAKLRIDAYVAKYPKSAQGHRLKGWIEFSLEHDDAARAAFDRALVLNPKEDNAHVGLGALARRQDKLDLARQHYQKAIELEPKNPEALASLVVLELKAKRYQKAIQVGERARSLDPKNPVVLANLSVAYHYVGNRDKRDQLFRLVRQNGYGNVQRLQKLFEGDLEL